MHDAFPNQRHDRYRRTEKCQLRSHGTSFSTAFTGQMQKQLPQWIQCLGSMTRGMVLLIQPWGHTLRQP